MRANVFLSDQLKDVRRISIDKAFAATTTHRHDFLTAYVEDLHNVIDMNAIRESGISVGVNPLGGAGVHYWEPIAKQYGLNLKVVNESVDPTFRFMILGLGWKNSHGSVLGIRHAAIDCIEGSV